MSLDILSAVSNLRDKIVTSSNTATPEELAYLGSALEKIGGKTSLYDVVDAAETKKQEILDASATVISELTATLNTTKSTIEGSIDSSIANYNNNINAKRDEVISELEAAITKASAAAALTQQQAVNGSKLRNMFYASALN